MMRGDMYNDLRSYDLAIAYYSRAIELNPNADNGCLLHDSAYLCRAAAYRLSDQFEEAIADYTHALELNVEIVFAYYMRGASYSDIGDYEQAADYTRAIELDPDNSGFWRTQAWLHYQNGNYVQAAADYEQASMLAPNQPRYYRSLGNVYLALGQREQALASYRRYLEMVGNNAESSVVERVRSLEHPFLIPGIATLSIFTGVGLSLVVWCNRWRLLYKRKRKHLVIG